MGAWAPSTFIGDFDLKYMLMFIDDETWNGLPQERRAEVYERIGIWFGEQGAAGRYLSGEELQPPTTATTVRSEGGKSIVSDGPFMEAKETIGGFAIIEVADLDEAIAIAKSWPGLGGVEIRPVVDHSSGM